MNSLPNTELTVAELATRMKMSERTIYRLAGAGEIPAYRVGRQLRFDYDEVRAALRAAQIATLTPVTGGA